MSLHRIDELFNFEKGSLQSSKCVSGYYNFITASADWKTHKEFTYDCEALVFAAAAAGSLGRIHYVNDKFIASDLCFVLTPKDTEHFPIDLRFYHLIFRELRNDIVRNTKAGTSKEAISLGNFAKYKLPYFAIEKQADIRNRFVGAEDTKENLSIELNRLSGLVKELRQAYLREAMQGKLVPQELTDEPAEILLEKIRAEKEKLVAEKRIKQNKPLPPINAEEIPFEIPSNWTWCRFGEILNEIKYGTSNSCDYDSERNSAVLRIPNVSSGIIDESDLKYTDLTTEEIVDLALEESDILIIRSNGSKSLVGETALVTSKFVGFAFAGYLIRLRFNKDLIEANYLMAATNAEYFRDLIEIPLRTTVGINNINTTEISQLMIPLPPLAEQERIVAKLDKLMKFCDELEANIKEGITNADRLLQTALKEALDPQTTHDTASR